MPSGNDAGNMRVFATSGGVSAYCTERSTRQPVEYVRHSMWFLFILMALGACLVTSGTTLFGFAIANAVMAVWSNGVLANYRRDAQAAPNWAALISMLTLLGSIGLGIAGLAIR
jgi:hypothetical protein